MYVIAKSKGGWHLKWNPDAGDVDEVVVLAFDPPGFAEYWIGLSRVHEYDWEEHIRGKSWITTEEFLNFVDLLTFARSLVISESQSRRGEIIDPFEL